MYLFWHVWSPGPWVPVSWVLGPDRPGSKMVRVQNRPGPKMSRNLGLRSVQSDPSHRDSMFPFCFTHLDRKSDWASTIHVKKIDLDRKYMWLPIASLLAPYCIPIGQKKHESLWRPMNQYKFAPGAVSIHQILKSQFNINESIQKMYIQI